MLLTHQLTQRWFTFALMLFAATLPIGGDVNNWVIGLLLLLWVPTLFNGPFFHHQKLKQEFLLAVVMFLLFVLGMFYTQNLKQGFKDIEQKLALVVFPLLLFTSIQVSKNTLQKVLAAFAFSCAGLSVYLVAVGSYGALQTGDVARLFYHQLAAGVHMHAVYLSAYFVFASFILIIHLLKSKKAQPKEKLLVKAAILMLGLTILLLASKTIIAIYICICIALLVRHFYHRKKATSGIAWSVGLALGILLVVNFVPYIKQRADDILNSKLEVLQQEEFRYDTEFSGLTLRLLFWKYAVDIVDREDAWLLGIGTGDSQDALNQEYLKHKLYSGNGKEDTGYLGYDSHSQFAETFLKLGLLGLFYLIFYFTRSLALSIKAQSATFTIFMVVFIAFSITESTLQSNKGVLFFAFFNSLFIAYLRTKEQDENTSGIRLL